MTLKLNIIAGVAGLYEGTYPLSKLTQEILRTARLNLRTGAGDGEAELLFGDRRTLGAFASEDLDLAGSLTDAYGQTLIFSDVKAILLVADPTNSAALSIGGKGTGAFKGPLATKAAKVTLEPGGFMLWTAPGAGRWPVVADTDDLLRISNAAGVGTATYEVVVIGGRWTPSAPTGAPVNTVLPAISGIATVGQALSVNVGSWTQSPTDYARQWRRGGVAIGGATSSSYVLQPADAGADVTCAVTASNDLGASATAISNAFTIAAALSVAGSPATGIDVGDAYTFTPTATGGHAPYTFSITGDLPAWLDFDPATGELSGVADTEGAISGIVLSVADANGLTAQLAPFTINVTLPPLAETLALTARMSVAPSAARQSAIDHLVRALVDADIWDALDAFYVLAAADSQAARLNWKSSSFNLTEVGGVTFTADKGYVGNASTGALATGLTPSTAGGNFAKDAAGFGAYVSANTIGGTQADIGAQGGTGNTFSGINGSSASELAALNQASGTGTVNAQGKSGLWSYVRTGASARKTYCGAYNVESVTTASTALPSGQFRLLASTSAFFSSRPIAAAWIGGVLSDAQVAALSEAIDTYLRTINSSFLKARSFLCHGNSLTAGFAGSAGADYPTVMQSAIGANYKVFNIGTAGYTTQQLAADIATAKIRVPAQYPSRSREVILWELRNDLVNNGLTAQQAVDNLAAACALHRALGCDKIWVATAIADGSSGGMSTSLQNATNTILRNTFSEFADALIDLAADPRLQNPANTTYYQTDKLHLTDAGYSAVAAIVQAALGL